MKTGSRARQATYSAPPEVLPPSPWWGVLIIVVVLGFLIGGAYAGLWMWAVTGPKVVVVPNLVGVEETAAMQILIQRGLNGKVVAREHHERLSSGKVLRTFPGPNSRVKQGRTVEMIVSAGSGWVFVPDVAEMSLGRARERIEGTGLRIGRERRAASEQVPEGYIIVQEPAAGKRVKRGSTVNLVISTGSRRASAEGRVKYARVEVSLPPGEGATKVRIEVQDDDGQRVAYEGEHEAGSEFAKTVVGRGKMTVRVYANDELTQEENF